MLIKKCQTKQSGMVPLNIIHYVINVFCQPLLYMYLFKTLSTSIVQVITHFPNDNYKKTTIIRDYIR